MCTEAKNAGARSICLVCGCSCWSTLAARGRRRCQAKLQQLVKKRKTFDTLLEKHTGEKTDDVAEILFMKGMLYAQVLENDDCGRAG